MPIMHAACCITEGAGRGGIWSAAQILPKTLLPAGQRARVTSLANSQPLSQ